MKKVYQQICTILYISSLIMIFFSTLCCGYVNDSDNLNNDSDFAIKLSTEPVITNNHRLGNQKEIDDYSTRSFRSSVRSSEAPWPMFKNTPNRLGSSSTSIPGESILWSNQTAPTASSPVVAYGKVYMSTGDGHIFCFEETTGRLCWKVRVTPKDYAAITTPSINNGYLIAYSSGDGKLRRLNAYTGEQNWIYTLPANKGILNISFIDRPILIYNGLVFFGAPNRYFYCIDETTGKLVWRYQTEAGLSYKYGISGGAAAVGDEIYFGANDGYLYAMDINGFRDGINDGSWQLESERTTIDGDVLWKFYTGDSISSTPLILNDYVYITVGTHNSSLNDYKIYKIFCLNRTSGVTVWEYKTEDHIVSSPAVAGSRLIFGSLDKKIYCLGTDSNTSYWVPYTTTGAIWSSAAVSTTGNKLVIGSRDTKVYCLSINNGLLVWQKKLDAPIVSSPALANDRIFINSQLGTLYCIGVADNKMPSIQSTIPASGEKNVPVSNYIKVQFNEPLHLATIRTSNIIVQNSKNELMPIEIEYDDPTNTITIIPKEYLNVSENYSVTIKPGIHDCAGNPLDGNNNGNSDGSPIDDYTWYFTTSDNNPPKLTEAKVTPEIGNLGTEFGFTVIYTDKDDNPPSTEPGKWIKIFINGNPQGKPMTLDTNPGIPNFLNDNKYWNGQQYKYSEKINTVGIHSFRIWCSDGVDWNETIVLDQPVIPGPPELKSIPDLYAKEDLDLVLNLTGYLSDPDTPLDQLIVNVNTSYAHVNGTEITFLYPNSFNYPSGRKFELINISVSDGNFFTYSEVKVWVEAINDPPTIKEIPIQIVIENRASMINLTKYIGDIDNSFYELNLSEYSTYTEIHGGDMIFNYPSGINKDIIHLNVSDGELWSNTIINIEVVSSEVSFVLRKIPDLDVIEDIDYELDLSDFIIIIKGSLENLALNCSSNYAKISGLRINFLYPDLFTYSKQLNSEEVTITVIDSVVNYSQSTKIRVHVTSINDAPILFNGTVDPEYGNISTPFTFKVNYYDIDGSGNIIVNVFVDGKKHSMTKIGGDKTSFSGIEYSISMLMDIGYHYCSFHCDDGTGAPNSQYSTQNIQFFVTGNLAGYIGEGGHNQSGLDTEDSDTDGIPDIWELLHGLNPTNHSDALADLDGDNFNNLLEYFGHDGLPGGNDSTNPNNITDKPEIIPEEIKKTESTIKDWQLLSVVSVIILVIIIIIYYMFLARGLGRTFEIPTTSSEIKEPLDEEVIEDIGEEAGEEGDLALVRGEEPVDDESVEGDLAEEEPVPEVPVTEVDLTADDQPFFESDAMDEEVKDEVEEEVISEEKEKPPKKTVKKRKRPKVKKK